MFAQTLRRNAMVMRGCKRTPNWRASFSSSRTSANAAGSSDDDRKERIYKAFDEIDTEGAGVISKDQFAGAVHQWDETELRKLTRSLSRNELSRTMSRGGTRKPSPMPTKVHGVEEEAEEVTKKSLGDIFASRVGTTAEVAISKIFMAGFGWQGFSCIAEAYGLAADTASFALVTGLGDFTGVCLGHSLWMLGKSALVDDTIDTTAEIHTGILLGTAAFFSGTTWQPLVNLLHDTLHLGFNETCLLTMAGCGMAFYGGLRIGRTIYSPILYGVEECNYANLKADAALSISVGAATGCFVGTDLSFGAENWMGGVLGVQDSFSPLHGMMLAGSSTAVGFTAVQMVQNVAVAPGRNWVD